MFSLYLHIPYCTKICPYCDFNVYAVEPRPERRYVEALLAEMRRAAIDVPWRGNVVESIYLGGGTPSLFDPESIRQVIDTARDLWSFDLETEVTLEATPESVDATKLARYRAAGVNRLSLGLESMQQRHLERLGRLHSPAQNRAAVEAARAAGFDNVSIDLIFAVPGQTLAEWEADLYDAVSLRPDHVSAYGLTYEERTPFYTERARGRLTPVAEDQEEAMFLRAREILAAAGYEPYEISSVALPGRRSRHNRNYWNGTPYLGLGAGAHSYSPEGWGRRWSNERNPTRYIAAIAASGAARTDVEHLRRDQAMGEFVFLGLRQSSGVDLLEFTRRFGEPFEARFPFAEELRRDGLAETVGSAFRLTQRGLLVADTIFARFF